MNTSRTLRIARFLREAVHYDPSTREKYRYLDRNQALEKYRGQSDVFISFTELGHPEDRQKIPYPSRVKYPLQPKLGINPVPTYHSTPLGVYAYPVDYTLDKYDADRGVFRVPYAGRAALIHVFRVTDMSQVLVIDSDTQYSSHENSDFLYPYEKELKALPEVNRLSDDTYHTIKAEVLSSRPLSFIYKMTEKLSGYNVVKWASLMRKVGLTGVVDYGNRMIHQSEDTQAVFFEPRILQVLETVDNSTPRQLQQRDSTREDLSKWSQESRDRFSHVVYMITREFEVLQEYENPELLYNFQSGDYYTTYSTLWDIQRYLSWLKYHQGEDPDRIYWSPEVKEKTRLLVSKFLAPIWNQNIKTPIPRRAQIILKLLDSF